MVVILKLEIDLVLVLASSLILDVLFQLLEFVYGGRSLICYTTMYACHF